jgi:hypothetical protein
MAGRIYLIADTRESHVLGFLKQETEEAGIDLKIAQINTADYLICRALDAAEPQVLAAIERKTLIDFSASLRDGRSGNFQKMIELRQRAGAQLYLILEGPAFPQPTRIVAKMPYSTILAAITALMVRDGIFLIQAADQSHSAKRLVDLVRTFGKVLEPYAAGGAIEPQGPPTDGPALPPAVPAELLGLVAKSEATVAAEAWARLKGVSLPTGLVLARAFSARSLIEGEVSAETLAAVRTAGGRPLAKCAKAALAAIQAGKGAESARLLSGVPGVSPALAAALLREKPLRQLLAEGEAALAAARVPHGGRQVAFGPTRARRVLAVLAFGGEDQDTARLPAPA